MKKSFANKNTCLDCLYSNKGFCFAPFNYVFIVANGDVFPCCYSQTIRSVCMGNVFDEQILNILTGSKAKGLLQDSINGTLKCDVNILELKNLNDAAICTKSCKKHNKTNLDFDDIIGHRNLKHISYLQLELGFFCNSRCAMCKQHNDDQRQLTYNQQKDIIKATSPDTIGLQGGEVYYIDGAKDFMLWLKDNKGKAKVTNHTNGNMPLSFAEDFIALYDYTELSTYGSSPATHEAVTGMKFEKTWQFMEEIIKIRNNTPEYSDKTIGSKMTIVPTAFHEIPDMCFLAEDKGTDYISFGFDFFVRAAFVKRYDNDFTKRVWKRLNKVLDRLTIPYDCRQLELLGFKREGGSISTREKCKNDSSEIIQTPDIQRAFKDKPPMDIKAMSEDTIKKLQKLCENNGRPLHAKYLKAITTPQIGSAKFILNELIKEEPDFAEAYFSLGELYEKTKDMESAAENYKKAWELQPSWGLVKEKLSIINKL